MSQQRNPKIQSVHLSRVRARTRQTRPQVEVCLKAQAKSHEMGDAVTNHWLTTQRKPLEEVEPIAALRWLLRKYFAWRGFACRSHVCNNEDGRHGSGKTVACSECGAPVVVLCDGKCYASIEYRGTFENESDGRWAANCRGGEVKPIPFDAALPEETVSYGVGDVPQSEASQFYRKGVMLPFAAVPRKEIDDRLLLEAKIEQVARAASVA